MTTKQKMLMRAFVVLHYIAWPIDELKIRIVRAMNKSLT